MPWSAPASCSRVFLHDGCYAATHHRSLVPGNRAAGSVIAYGHWGRPVLVFPHEMGRAEDFESWDMIGAVADLVDGGG